MNELASISLVIQGKVSHNIGGIHISFAVKWIPWSDKCMQHEFRVDKESFKSTDSCFGRSTASKEESLSRASI